MKFKMVKKQKMTQALFLIGLLLIIVGIIFIVTSAFTSGKGKGKVEIAAGGFIGPIPFGFFSSPQMFWIWLALFAALLVIWFIILRLPR